MGALASIKCFLGLLTTFLLEWPSVIAIKLNHADAIEAILLGNDIPPIDLRVGLLSIVDDVATVVDAMDAPSTHVIGRALAHGGPLVN